MADIHPSHLSFDRGIDRIIHASEGKAGALPEREQAQPPDMAARPQLETLLALPTLDDALDAAVRPQLHNRDLLVPARFRQALDQTLERLGQAAQQAQEARPTDDGSDTARTLNRAVRLLKEESALRDLLQMYRSALYQG